MMKNRTIKLAAAIFIFLLVSLAAELLLFNFRALRSAGDSWTDLQIVDAADNSLNSENKKLVFRNVNATIKYCHIDLIVRDESGEVIPTTIRLRITDEGHSTFYEIGSVSYLQDHPVDSYFPVHSYGKVLDLELIPQVGATDTVYLEKAEINGSVPFFFSARRVAAFFALLLVLYLLRPSSLLHDNSIWNNRRFAKAFCIALVLILNVSLLFQFIQMNEPYIDIPEAYNWEHHAQYPKLARSIAEGRVSIETQQDESTLALLASLDNPYDLSARVNYFNAHGSHAPWDTAYYNGHLYVYFGVLPVILLYLPYYLFTGNDLPNWIAIFLALSSVLIAAYIFVRSIIRRFFPYTPFSVYLLLSVLLGNCTCVIQYTFVPGFYTLPIALSVSSVMFGLALWISAACSWESSLGLEPPSSPHEDSKQPCFAAIRSNTPARISACLLIGSLLMALVAGSRPQFLIYSFLAFPIFSRIIRSEKKPGKLPIRILLALLPYVLIGACIMWYNFIRFDSPFDFGANYNLTTNDMRLRGFSAARLPDGLFSYLLQPPNISLSFPYVHEVEMDPVYLGQTIHAHLCGGALICSSFLWILLFSGSASAGLREIGLRGLFSISLLAALVVIAADTEMAGIIARYFGDFQLLLYVSSALVFLTLLEKTNGKARNRLFVFLTISLILTVCFQFFMGITAGELSRHAPESFIALRSLFIA